MTIFEIRTALLGVNVKTTSKMKIDELEDLYSLHKESIENSSLKVEEVKTFQDTNKLSIAIQTLGTILILYSWVSIAYGNTLQHSFLIPPYPYNYVAEITGCFLWACIGVRWKNMNVVVVNGALCILATIGIFTNIV